MEVETSSLQQQPSLESEGEKKVSQGTLNEMAIGSAPENGGNENTAPMSPELHKDTTEDEEGPVSPEPHVGNEEVEKMETNTPGDSTSTDSVQNGEAGTPQLKKRNRSRDDLSLSPDMTKTGKRQRKTNSLYSGYAIDKRTSQVIGQDGKEGEPIVIPVEPIATPTTPTTPTSMPDPTTPNTGEITSLSAGKKEVLLTPQDAQVKAKKLPKGYAYEPVMLAASRNDPLPPKRERKKVALADYVDSEKQSGPLAKLPKKQKTPKPKKQKKLLTVTIPSGEAPPPPPADEVTTQMLKKQELENQLNALTQQLAMVSQTLETKTKQVQALEKMEKVEGSNLSAEGLVETKVEPTTPSSEEGSFTQIALPSGTTIRQNVGNKKQPVSRKTKRNQSVYDRFESDDDAPGPKKVRGKTDRKGGKGKDSGARPQRNRRKSRSFDEDSEEEPVGMKLEPDEDFVVSDDLKSSLKILQGLKKHSYAWPFVQPVDPVQLNIPDYLDIIKRPMDLGTENLKSGLYTTIDEFGEDVRLVFKNAVTYNQPGSDICIMANTLANLFEKQFSKLGGKPPKTPTPAAIPTPITTPTTSGRLRISKRLRTKENPATSAEDAVLTKTKADLANTINNLKYSMETVQKEISKLKREKTTNSPTSGTPRSRPPKQIKEKEEVREMTFGEKRALCVKINQLQPESLGKVVQIIHSRMPNLAQNSPDEIEIDIDALDTATLRALEKYVKGQLNKKKGKRTTPLPKHLQAEQTAQNTSKSIQDVKKKLKELSSKSSGETKSKKKKDQEDTEDIDIDDDAPARTYPSVEIPKDKPSSSSSSSSSDDSSSSSDSSSDSEGEKKINTPESMASSVTSTVPTSAPTVALHTSESDQRDNILPSPEREAKSEAMEGVSHEASELSEAPKNVEPESPHILPPVSAKKEVELKNLDSWANLTDIPVGSSSSDSMKKDDTWSQFQSRDLQNKQREKEREEQQEREKRDREARELERRRAEEQRAKELQELEKKKQDEEEEAKQAAQRELAAKRAAEKKAREQASATSINMLEQNTMMSSFEMGLDVMNPANVLKLKEGEKEGGEM